MSEKSTLVQVMAWCHQATSHYLNQCWPRSLTPYGVTGPQWVKPPIGYPGQEKFNKQMVYQFFLWSKQCLNESINIHMVRKDENNQDFWILKLQSDTNIFVSLDCSISDIPAEIDGCVKQYIYTISFRPSAYSLRIYRSGHEGETDHCLVT